MGVRRLSVEAGGIAPEPGERLLRHGCVNVLEPLLQTAGVHRRTWTPRCVTFRVEAVDAPILYLLERLVSSDRLHAGTHPVVHDAVDVVSPCRRCPVPSSAMSPWLVPCPWSPSHPLSPSRAVVYRNVRQEQEDNGDKDNGDDWGTRDEGGKGRGGMGMGGHVPGSPRSLSKRPPKPANLLRCPSSSTPLCFLLLPSLSISLLPSLSSIALTC